jgi:hypothetical protein
VADEGMGTPVTTRLARRGAVPVAGIQRAVGCGCPGNPGVRRGSAAGPTSGPELDALAARLYSGSASWRELLADRERAGVLVDMGH